MSISSSVSAPISSSVSAPITEQIILNHLQRLNLISPALIDYRKVRIILRYNDGNMMLADDVILKKLHNIIAADDVEDIYLINVFTCKLIAKIDSKSIIKIDKEHYINIVSFHEKFINLNILIMTSKFEEIYVDNIVDYCHIPEINRFSNAVLKFARDLMNYAIVDTELACEAIEQDNDEKFTEFLLCIRFLSFSIIKIFCKITIRNIFE